MKHSFFSSKSYASLSASVFLLLIMICLVGMVSCSSTAPSPPWIERIQRLPVKTVEINGYRIAYLDVGQGDPVILIHGFGGSMWQWEYQHMALSSQYRVITLDLLGSGLSEKPDVSYSPSTDD